MNVLSLLVPAHTAQGFLPDLVSRLLSQSTVSTPIEIVVSSDDGFNYKSILPADHRVVFAEPGLNTGPALARNRALSRATGSHVCMMDADDSVSARFLVRVFEALQRYPAFALRSVYERNGAPVRRFMPQILTLDSYLDFYGSVLAVAPRENFPQFLDVVVEDGLATLTVMHRYGDSLPVIDAEYLIRLHPESFCAVQGHTFTDRYREHLTRVEEFAAALGQPGLAPAIARLYHTRWVKSFQFDHYVDAGGCLGYHEFVANHITQAGGTDSLGQSSHLVQQIDQDKHHDNICS